MMATSTVHSQNRSIVIRTIHGNHPFAIEIPNHVGSNIVDLNTADTRMDSIGKITRKRQRLNHLTPDERMLRRKLKNRVAAQTARDRKKERMQELEEALAELEAENKRLQNENNILKQATGDLSDENVVLKEKLGLGCEEHVAGRCDSPGSAAGAESHLPPDIFTLPHSPHSNNAESDLIELLQQIIEGPQEESSTENPGETDTSSETAASTIVVGPTTAELESAKELMEFDHIYYKHQSPSPIHNQPAIESNQDDCPITVTSMSTPSSMVSIVAPRTIPVDPQTSPSTETALTISVTAPNPVDIISDTITDQKPIENDLNNFMNNELDLLFDLSDLSDFDENFQAMPLTPENVPLCDTKPVLFDSGDIMKCDDQILSPSSTGTSSASDESVIDYSDNMKSPFHVSDGLWEESFTELFPSLM